MNSSFKLFRNLILFLVIEFFLCFSFFIIQYSSYDKNLFEITLNGMEMKCYYTEKYTNGLLINTGVSSYNSVEKEINEIDLNKDIILNINEYEVYYKSGGRKRDTNGWLKQDNLNYKKVNNSNMRLEIKRKNKVLYKGNYTSNLSSIINEKGRYYIHIYSTRKDGILTSIKTHISFNVIVGGGNRE